MDERFLENSRELRFDAHALERSTSYRAWLKRVCDILIVLTALPMVLPIILLVGMVVMVDGGAPFFGHRRVGRNGKIFRCWKLRTMVRDAESRLEAHLLRDGEARAEWETSFKLTHDPRITFIGDFLRRSSLDELPQLWNVFKGDMSIVGPRPVTEKELVLYGSARRYYESIRPGVTGLWQVSGRNDLAYHERVALDLRYVRDHDPLMDAGIILKTFYAVVCRTGR